jgi:hypothetical protein
MLSDKGSALSRPPSAPTKPDTSLPSERLTPSEIERLRRVQRAQSDYARRAFANPRPKGHQIPPESP